MCDIKLYSYGDNYKLYHGNMLDMLAVIEPNSIDAIVTDPPYELNFMGRDWDNSGIAFQKETWEKCLKVLKSGGYLLSFGGSRTFHRIACAIEDAGFEIRDTIMYLYGTGFPKSMNIAKGVEAKLTTGSANKQAFKDLSGEKVDRGNFGYASMWYEQGGRPADYNDIDAQRLGKLEPTTEEAKRWQGFGTALKPAYEPIIVARKPCEGSCIDNVLKYGVGGINIDECRVPHNEPVETMHRHTDKGNNTTLHTYGDSETDCIASPNEQGRFPANVILTYDETDFDEVCGGMPYTKSTGGSGEASKKSTLGNFEGGWQHDQNCAHLGGLGDEGSAARYFMRCNYNNRDEVNLWEHLFVNNAETNLQILNTQRELFVQQDVGQLLSDMKFHYVKYAENLSVLIETPIVHDIAKILTWDFRIETSQVIQDFIINFKKCTQFQNLVQFVETLDNIDTTPTTQNLLKLFGYVKVVITNYILGNIEFDQKRYIYSPKASKRDRDEGLPNGKHNIHPTVKNTALMQYLVRLVTPKGGTILDPFNGSGSTGKAAMYENKDRTAGYKYIGIELTSEYLPIADARIRFALGDNTPVEYSGLISNKATPKSVNSSGQISLFDENT